MMCEQQHADGQYMHISCTLSCYTTAAVTTAALDDHTCADFTIDLVVMSCLDAGNALQRDERSSSKQANAQA